MVQATGHATMDANGSIKAVIVDNPGSGYSVAPTVTIHNGTVSNPARSCQGSPLWQHPP